jgi:MFS family permease
MKTGEKGQRWYEGLTAVHWMVLAVASAGWVFDVYEGQLFTIFKTPMLKELTGGDAAAIDWEGNLGLAAFLLGGAAGGLFFSVLGDRYGRVRVMAYTILVYSIFSALTYFAQSTTQVLVLRFLVALGAGGEWAVAAALVAETFPAHFRASASGIFHASSVLGTALASLTGVILSDPGKWRWAFLVGLAPSLLVLWIRVGIREPERWVKAVKSTVDALGDDATGTAATGTIEESSPKPAAPAHGDLRELFGIEPWRTRAFLGLALATVGLATFWGIFAWSPELIRLILGDTLPQSQRGEMASRTYLIMNCTGGLLGLLSFAPLASWRGRRFAFAVYHIGAAIVAPLAFLWASTYVQATCLLTLMAFFVLGMHAGYAIYFPELFPTRLRATGSSVCFNLGRVLGALILIVRGRLGAELGLRHAVVAMSGLFLVGLVILIFAPETRGHELPD